MTHSSTRLKRIPTDFGSSRVDETSEDATFWRDGIGPDKIVKDFGSIDFLDFNPKDENELLVTSLARCSIYNSDSMEVLRTFKCQSQFQVYGGCYRGDDGRLVAVGSEEGKIFIFETKNTKPLRTLTDGKQVRAATRRVLFCNQQKTGGGTSTHGSSLISFCDDQYVKLWDISTGQLLQCYGPKNTGGENTGHSDYIRAGCMIDNLIVSGSYDSTVKFWDPRVSSEDLKPIMEFNHGRPVECLCTKGSSLVISVGGTQMNIFDLVSGKVIGEIKDTNHSKTITTCTNYQDKYLITGSLDGRLNVFNFDYQYITRIRTTTVDAQVLALTVNKKMLAIGLSDHRLIAKKINFKILDKKSCLGKRNSRESHSEFDPSLFGPHTVTRYFHEALAESHDDKDATRRAMLAIQQKNMLKKKRPIELQDEEPLYQQIVISDNSEFFVSRPIKTVACGLNGNAGPNTQLRDYEKYLAIYEHGKALDAAISRSRREPQVTVAVLVELVKRNRLELALKNCNDLEILVRFMAANLNKIQYNRTLVDVARILVDLCLEDEYFSERVRPLALAFRNLSSSLEKEDRIIQACMKIRGQISVILSQADCL